MYFRMGKAPFGMVDAPGAGIWARTASGKGSRRGRDPGLQFLWKFRSAVPIPKRLHTLQWAEAEVLKQWPDKMARSLKLAIASATGSIVTKPALTNQRAVA
jgi:hypothetical protein